MRTHDSGKSRNVRCEAITTDLNITSRLRLHDGKLIKERRYHLRTYPNCFVAQELVDWLVSYKEALDRPTAVCLMQHLMDHDIVHHGKKKAPQQQDILGTHSEKCKNDPAFCLSSVCDKWPVFKDAKRLYRFRKDDGTFPFNTEVKILMRGQRLYE